MVEADEPSIQIKVNLVRAAKNRVRAIVSDSIVEHHFVSDSNRIGLVRQGSSLKIKVSR